MNRLSDSRLVRRSQQGDRDAFLALLERYDHRLRGLAYALVTSEAGMERILRTSYLRAWREVVRADADDDAGTWLYRVTYNACIDELRRERARLDRPDDPANAGAAADTTDVDDPLVQALAALPPEHRLAVVLVDREGFTSTGAARIAGLDQELFDERLAAGRAALATALPTAAPRRRDAPGRRRPPGRPPRPATPTPAASTPPSGSPSPSSPAPPASPASPPDGTPAEAPPPPAAPPSPVTGTAAAAPDGTTADVAGPGPR